MNEPTLQDLEKLRKLNEAKATIRGWKDTLEKQFDNHEANVALSSDGDILEFRTKDGGNYVRIAYDASNPEKPFQQFAFTSKTNFYDPVENESHDPRMAKLTREMAEQLILNMRAWLSAQDEKEL